MTRSAFWAKCRICGHSWPVAYLPMEMGAVARLAKASACPACGDSKPGIAKQADGKLLEESEQ